MEFDVWIDFNEDFQPEWKGGDWAKDTSTHELARTRSPFFPCGHEAFWIVQELINTGKYKINYRDHITRYIYVEKTEILLIISKIKEKCKNIEWDGIYYLKDRCIDLEEFVNSFPNDRVYKLVCQEF
jgi:hypothetical protein